MIITAPGIYSGIPMEAYLADPCVVPSLNATTAVTLLKKSPRHAWVEHPRHPKPLPREESKVADVGTVAHAMLLEKDDTKCVVIRPEDHLNKDRSVPKKANAAMTAAYEEARARGLTPLLPEQMAACIAMRDAALTFIAELKKNPRGRPVAMAFEAGEAEAVAVSQEDAVWLRTRPDWISNDRSVVVHLKTTKRSAEPNSFIRGLLPSMGYDITLSFYQRVLAAATGVFPEINCILAQEQDPPYACSLIGLNPEYDSIMSTLVESAIKTWGKCMRTNVWPAYPTEICWAEPKPWQIADVEERGVVDFLARDPAQDEHGTQI